MSNNMESACQAVQRLAGSPMVIAPICLRVVLCGIAALATVSVLCTEKITSRFNPNARILIRSHFVFNLLACLSVFFVDGSDMVRILFVRTNKPDCPIPVLSEGLAKYLKGPEMFCVNVLGTSLMGLGIERTFATLYAQTYETYKRTYPSWILLILAVLYSASKCSLVFGHVGTVHWLPLTTIGHVPEYLERISLIVLLSIEVTNVVLFSALYLRNRRWRKLKSRITATLAYKFQIEENVQSLSLVLQLAFLHCLIVILSTVSFVCLLFFLTFDQLANVVVALDMYAIYNVLLPFFALLKMYLDKKRRNRVEAEARAQENKDYFIILNGFFHGDSKV